jgi:hypothetical protein
MPSQKFVTAWARHQQAVDALVHRLQRAGLKEFAGPVYEPPELPPFTFARAQRRAVQPRLGLVPRDLVARLGGEVFDWKVYFTNGSETHSSLFRSVGYALMAKGGRLLQTVTAAEDLPIRWLDELQGPLDPVTPAGIHGEDAVVRLIQSHLKTRTSKK